MGLRSGSGSARWERLGLAAYEAAFASSMAIPPRRTVYPQFVATVVGLTQLCPGFRRVTLRATQFVTLDRTGPDEYVGLYFPPVGQALRLPESTQRPRAALARLSPAERPALRWYTLRHHRPEQGEVDIDFVTTEHVGPGARWVGAVRAGDEVGVRVQTALYGAAPGVGRHVLIADETGLPGLLAILDHPSAASRSAYVEVPGPGFQHAEVETALREHAVRLVSRQGGAPGSALLPVLEAAELGEITYAWICAEASTMVAAKRHLMSRRGLPRRAVMASGLWKVGQPRL